MPAQGDVTPGRVRLEHVSIEHVTITARDFGRSLAFYDAALGALGLQRLHELVDEEEDDAEIEAAAWGLPDGPPLAWLVVGDVASTGLHLAFTIRSRVDVETFFTDAVAAGGQAHAAPRRWTIYRRGRYTAGVRDPDGNLIEVSAPE